MSQDVSLPLWAFVVPLAQAVLAVLRDHANPIAHPGTPAIGAAVV